MMSKRKVKRNDITRSAFMSEVLSYDDIMNNGSSSSNSSSSSSISNLPVNCGPSVNNNIDHDVVVDVGNSVDQHYQHTIVKSNSCDKVTEQIIRPSYRRRVIVYSDDYDDDDDEVVNEDKKEDYAKDAKDDEEDDDDDDDDDDDNNNTNKGDHNDHDFDEFNSNSSVEDEDGDITTDKSTHRSLSIPLSSSSEPFVIDLTSNQNVNRHHPTNQHQQQQKQQQQQQQQQQHDLQDIRSSSSSSTSLLSFNDAMLTNAEWLYHHLCSKFVHYEKTNLADGHVRFVS